MEEADLEELYQAIILDHYKNPRGYGTCDPPCQEHRSTNPLCGDEVCISLRQDGNQIEQIKFEGKGCAISQASSSLMVTLLAHKSIHDAQHLKALFEQLIVAEHVPEGSDALGDAALLRGIKKFPARYRCALLPWVALEPLLS